MNRMSWITNTNRVGFSFPSSVTNLVDSGKGSVASLTEAVSEPGKKYEAVKEGITTVKADYAKTKETAGEVATGAYVAIGVAAAVGLYLLATRK